MRHHPRPNDADAPHVRRPIPRGTADDPLPDNVRLVVALLALVVLALVAGRLPSLLRRGPKVEYQRLPAYQSFYLPMRDGTALAVSLWLPESVVKGRGTGCALRGCRAWRESDGSERRPESDPEAAVFVAQGMAAMRVDARGSGASYGSRAAPVMPEDRADLLEVADWIAAQPWSNGRIGAYGIGFDAQFAELLAGSHHAAVRAAAPLFGAFDPWLERHRPGGIVSAGFAAAVDARLAVADQPTGDPAMPARTLDDPDGRRRGEAVAAHSRNAPLLPLIQSAEFRGQAATAVFDGTAPFAAVARTPRIGVPTYLWAGWFDGATALSAVRRFVAAPGSVQVVIGPWGPYGTTLLDPLQPDAVPEVASLGTPLEATARFFRSLLVPDPAAPPVPPPGRWVKYFRLGANSWRSTDTWPPAVYRRDWHLAPGGRLRREPVPAEAESAGAVETLATSGPRNRWLAAAGDGTVEYGDRAAADAMLTCFTSPPLAARLRLEGHPVAHLWLSVDAGDVALIAYLEAVRPDGYVAYLTEGAFRARHRRVSSEDPPTPQFGPYHTYQARDVAPLVPGEPAEVAFDLLPMAADVPAGWRLRLAIACGDAGTFEAVPEAAGRLRLYHGPARPSRLTLPVAP